MVELHQHHISLEQLQQQLKKDVSALLRVVYGDFFLICGI